MNLKKTRILLISSNSSGRGGGEKYLVNMANGLSEHFCDVHVLLSSVQYMDTWAENYENIGIAVHRKKLLGLVDRPLRFIQSILDLKQQKTIAQFCRELHPDGILVNQQYDEDGLDYIMGSLLANICPVAGVIHMPMTADKNLRKFGRIRGKLIHCWYKKYLYDIIFVSSGCKKEFHDYYSLQRKTHVITSGVSFNKTTIPIENSISFKPFHSWIKQRKHLPILGNACQFVQQKNLPFFIESWIWTLGQQQSRLLLIGDGPERVKIEKLLARIDPALWHITGWVDHSQEYLRHLNLFVMPSLFEGLPLALIEALGLGIPSIVSDFNGTEEIKKKCNWVKVLHQQDISSLGKLIIKMLQNLDKLEKIAASEKNKFIQHFSPYQMASDFLKIINIKNQ